MFRIESHRSNTRPCGAPRWWTGCIYIRVYIHIHTYIYIYVYVYVYVYIYIYICYTYIYIMFRIESHRSNTRPCGAPRWWTGCIYTYVYIYIYICIYTYMYMYIFIYIYMLYIHIYILFRIESHRSNTRPCGAPRWWTGGSIARCSRRLCGSASAGAPCSSAVLPTSPGPPSQPVPKRERKLQLNAAGVVARLVFESMCNNSPVPGRAHGHGYFITRSTNVTVIRVSVTTSQPLVTLTKRAHRSRLG